MILDASWKALQGKMFQRRVCRILAGPRALAQGGVQTVSALSGLNIVIMGSETPLNVISLPVDENMRKDLRAHLVKAGVERFLDGHSWSPDTLWPTGEHAVGEDGREHE
jgi:hypothetical protein